MKKLLKDKSLYFIIAICVGGIFSIVWGACHLPQTYTLPPSETQIYCRFIESDFYYLLDTKGKRYRVEKDLFDIYYEKECCSCYECPERN